jgi:hypothetical protein
MADLLGCATGFPRMLGSRWTTTATTLILATPTPPPARLWWCAPAANPLHVAIQALALENARLRAELACYRTLERTHLPTRFE